MLLFQGDRARKQLTWGSLPSSALETLVLTGVGVTRELRGERRVFALPRAIWQGVGIFLVGTSRWRCGYHLVEAGVLLNILQFRGLPP